MMDCSLTLSICNITHQKLTDQHQQLAFKSYFKFPHLAINQIEQTQLLTSLQIYEEKADTWDKERLSPETKPNPLLKGIASSLSPDPEASPETAWARSPTKWQLWLILRDPLRLFGVLIEVGLLWTGYVSGMNTELARASMEIKRATLNTLGWNFYAKVVQRWYSTQAKDLYFVILVLWVFGSGMK